MADTCPTVQQGTTLLQSLLDATSCHSRQFAEAPYASLNGLIPGGLLTAALTIAVLLFGYGLLSGRMSMSLSSLGVPLLRTVILVAILTQWPIYQGVVYGAVANGPERVAASIFHEGSSRLTPLTPVDQLQHALDDLTLFTPADPAGPAHHDPYALASSHVQQIRYMSPPAFEALLFWLSAGLLGGSILGALLVSKILLAVILATGPLFILLALFSPTRGVSMGWLRISCALAATPVFATFALVTALALLEPTLTQIEAMNAQGLFTPGVAPKAITIALVTALALFSAIGAATLAAFKIAQQRNTSPSPAAAPIAPTRQPTDSQVQDRIGSITARLNSLDRT